MPTSSFRAAFIRSAIAAAAMLVLASTPAPAGEPDPSMPRPFGPPPRGNAPSLFARELELPDTLGVGRVADDVARELPRVEALSDYLNVRAAELGYARALPVLARDQDEMARFLRSGIVDVVSEGPLEAMHDEAESGASVLLRERRSGRAESSVVVFTREDSPVHKLRDLDQECFVFTEGNSGTAFLAPLAELRHAGLRLSRMSDPASEPDEEEAGFFLMTPPASIAKSVQQRVATAGALPSEDWEREQQQGNAGGLRIVHTFASLPRSLVVIGPNVNDSRRDALRRVLLAMPADDDGKAALQAYGDVTGLDAVGDEMRGSLERARILQALVSGEVR